MRKLNKDSQQGKIVTELPIDGVWIHYPVMLITTKQPFYARKGSNEGIRIFMLKGEPVISVPIHLLCAKLKATVDHILTANKTGMLKVEFDVDKMAEAKKAMHLHCDFELCTSQKKWRTNII